VLSGSFTGKQPRMEGLLLNDEFERIEKGIFANFWVLYRHLGSHDKPVRMTGHSGKELKQRPPEYRVGVPVT